MHVCTSLFNTQASSLRYVYKYFPKGFSNNRGVMGGGCLLSMYLLINILPLLGIKITILRYFQYVRIHTHTPSHVYTHIYKYRW